MVDGVDLSGLDEAMVTDMHVKGVSTIDMEMKNPSDESNKSDKLAMAAPHGDYSLGTHEIVS